MLSISPVKNGAPACRVLESPLGSLLAFAGDRGLFRIRFGGSAALPASKTGQNPQAGRWLDLLECQLAEYFRGQRKQFNLPLDLRGSTFQLSAWKVLRGIPYGETLSYREQAFRMKNPRALRAVGTANGANPIPILIPCHRVIRSDGSSGGYAGGVIVKQKLLDLERGFGGSAE